MTTRYDATVSTSLLQEQTTVAVDAHFLGQRIALNAFYQSLNSGVLTPTESPLTVTIGQGCGVLFDYGVVVLFGLNDDQAKAAFLAQLTPYIEEPFDQPETESALIKTDPTQVGKVQEGLILLNSLRQPALQIVAEVMAKSVVLAYYELGAAQVFDHIEPFAASLQHQHSQQHEGRQLLQQIGNTLMIQHKIVGRVEMIDKPDLLWDHPELDSLYLRLADEYEITERHTVLERKLALVTRTAETVLELQQQHTGLRLERYVVILIVVEILLSLYELIFRL